MSANKFLLKHRQIEIDYTLGGTPGLTALTYKDGSDVKNFTANELTTEETALGTLVSFPLLLSVDTGGERFGFFLPHLDLALGHTEKFMTAGVYEKFSGPNSIPHLPPSWHCIDLHGTAESVIVFLTESAAS
jgi:hypothetical protein